MDYKKDLIELIAKYNQLILDLKDAEERWQRADAGSETEQEAERDKKTLSAQIDPLMEDISYLKKKVFTPEDWGTDFVNYIQIGGTLMSMTLKNLQTVANDFGYSYKSYADQNRIVFIFDKEDEEDGMPLQVAVNFILEDSFLRSYSCPIGNEVHDEKLKEQILKDLNEYNERTRIMKAYIDNEGSVCLERQDIIDRGFTKENLKQIIEFVIRSVADFYKNRSEAYLTYLKSL